MGNSHSAGRDNDELVDILIKEKYIETKEVEEAFRRIDRGDYIPDFPPAQIYADQTLRKEYLHLSAPCIYAKVTEALNIKLGNSFLNIGSGTGYLSTIVGSLIGPSAINHGVELREETVRHAYTCLEKYITTCVMFDASRLAIPSFVTGNGLDIDPDYRKYDRIYVGAEVPQEHKHLICSLLREGGILVMPFMGQLVAVTKTEDKYDYEELLPVSFSPLMTPEMLAEEKGMYIHEPQIPIRIEVRLRSLQELCRLVVYSCVGRDHMHKIRTLPLSPALQEYVRYYRDPALPSHKPRAKYTSPPATPQTPELPDPLGLRDYIRMMHAVEYSSEDEEDAMDLSGDEADTLSSDSEEIVDSEGENAGIINQEDESENYSTEEDITSDRLPSELSDSNPSEGSSRATQSSQES